MLNEPYSISGRRFSRSPERGVILVIVLIVLVAMTLAGVALMRSVNTSTLVAGNLAYKQAALRAADLGTESAIAFLKANSSGTALNSDILPSGYIASQQEPAAGQSWDDYWRTSLDPHPLSRPVAADSNSGNVWTLATDQQGNTVSYVIHRMCKNTGDPAAVGTNCAVTPSAAENVGNSMAAGSVALEHASQIYYRITTRVDGPRNTVSFIQTIIAL